MLWQLKSFSIKSSCGEFTSWIICQQRVDVFKAQGFPRKTNHFVADYCPYLKPPQKEQPHFLYSDWIKFWIFEELLFIKLETKFSLMYFTSNLHDFQWFLSLQWSLSLRLLIKLWTWLVSLYWRAECQSELLSQLSKVVKHFLSRQYNTDSSFAFSTWTVPEL